MGSSSQRRRRTEEKKKKVSVRRGPEYDLTEWKAIKDWGQMVFFFQVASTYFRTFRAKDTGHFLTNNNLKLYRKLKKLSFNINGLYFVMLNYRQYFFKYSRLNSLFRNRPDATILKVVQLKNPFVNILIILDQFY